MDITAKQKKLEKIKELEATRAQMDAYQRVGDEERGLLNEISPDAVVPENEEREENLQAYLQVQLKSISQVLPSEGVGKKQTLRPLQEESGKDKGVICRLDPAAESFVPCDL